MPRIPCPQNNWATPQLLINFIRVTGWTGFIIGAFAVLFKSPDLFIFWQVVANLSGFAYNSFLQNKLSADVVLSLIVTILAAITKDVNLAYSAMLIRSLSYQLIFERVNSERLNLKNSNKNG